MPANPRQHWNRRSLIGIKVFKVLLFNTLNTTGSEVELTTKNNHRIRHQELHQQFTVTTQKLSGNMTARGNFVPSSPFIGKVAGARKSLRRARNGTRRPVKLKIGTGVVPMPRQGLQRLKRSALQLERPCSGRRDIFPRSGRNIETWIGCVMLGPTLPCKQTVSKSYCCWLLCLIANQ